jgi:ubiquinone/menaquinone biosynthesis C-methylase UbiE
VVQKGNFWFKQENITNVQLFEGKANDLEQFQDRCFDVVFTDAVLIYVGPDKIEEIINHMIRITKRAIIFVEWHSVDKRKDPEGLGIYYLGNWKRDYFALLKHFVPEEAISVTKISEEVWPAKVWKEIGAIIEVSV